MTDEARTHGCTEQRRDVEILLANHTWHVAAVLVSAPLGSPLRAIRLRPLHCQMDRGMTLASPRAPKPGESPSLIA
jgi:hypothetical protein